MPNEQLVYFYDGTEQYAAERAKSRFTHLKAWFDLNQSDLFARTFYYTQIPMYYFYANNISWKKRKNCGDKIVPRMHNVFPNDQERFYLRIFLMNIKEVQSFEDLS